MLQKPVGKCNRKETSFIPSGQLQNQTTICQILGQINPSPFYPSSLEFNFTFNLPPPKYIQLSLTLFLRTAGTNCACISSLSFVSVCTAHFQLAKFKRTGNQLVCRIMKFPLFKRNNKHLESKSAGSNGMQAVTAKGPKCPLLHYTGNPRIRHSTLF
jgi:hypothetical protein